MLRKVQEERIASGEYEMSNGVLVRKGITVSWKTFVLKDLVTFNQTTTFSSLPIHFIKTPSLYDFFLSQFF